MCGFAGFLLTEASRSASYLEAEVGAMAGTLAHRGPDSSGVWTDADAGVALGHRRLSILDLSADGHQPMVSQDGRFVVAFNGEIYNFREIRARLGSFGHAFRGGSDTEVLVEAIAAWGVREAVERAVGMFAFAVWDRQGRVLTLARDRMGEKPLYYGWGGSVFLFGSELKALRVHPSWHGTIDRTALTLYLRHNYVPGPRTIYRGVLKLPPGCILQVSRPVSEGLPEPKPYWNVEVGSDDAAVPRSDDEAVSRLEQLLLTAVERQMLADVPLGAFLSGGIDSSTVVALMQRVSERPVRTFTIGVHDSDRDEAPAARAVAEHLRTDHTELYVRPEEALDVIPLLSRVYDEPFADSSQIPTYLVSQLARQSVTVSLSGDGGDELFGGYERYVRGPRLGRQLGWIPGPVRRGLGRGLLTRSAAAWLQALPVRDGGLLAERAVRLGEVLATRSPLAIHRGLLSNWPQPEALVHGGHEPLTLFTTPALPRAPQSLAEQMLLIDTVTYLPDDLLVKVDRAAMACSLETRVPMLDHHVVEFALRLPWDLKVRGEERKWILRQVLYRHVPRTLVDRPKKGFGVPMGEWLRGPLKAWAGRLLRKERLQEEGFFRPEPIVARWNEHLAGRGDWSYPLWTVLMFQAWFEAQTAESARG